MKKGLIINNNKMGKYEIEKRYASYKTIIDYYVGDIVLCNNIVDVDPSIWDNVELSQMYQDDLPEIYQFYLCNIGEYEKEEAKKAGLIFSYSNKLECDVLLVDHYGTSWDYVLTDVKLFDSYEELEKWERGE